MEQLIAAFPQNILQAAQAAEKLNFSQPKNKIENIVFVGMGVWNWSQNSFKMD